MLGAEFLKLFMVDLRYYVINSFSFKDSKFSQLPTTNFCLNSSCKINWVQGKNVTMKTVKKRQKHKQTGTMRTVTKESPADSFFNFFDPPQGK